MSHRSSLDRLILSFQQSVEGHISNLLTSKSALLPEWIPHPFLKEEQSRHSVLDHLQSLNMPAVLTDEDESLHKPNLLLYDLGGELYTSNPSNKARINELFGNGKHKLLINPSGSGKTRIVLEGLCQNWGFYFTCQTIFNPHESLSFGLPSQAGFTQKLPDSITEADAMLRINWSITSHWFNAALLARLVLFERFLSIADLHHMSPDVEIHRRWTLAQALPHYVFQTDQIDVLNLLTQDIGKLATATDIEAALDIYWEKVATILNKLNPSLKSKRQKPRIFVVIDEAQDGISQLPSAFMSGSMADEKHRSKRPVLRQLVFTFTSAFDKVKHLVNTAYVITGTGISSEMLEEAISSVYFKEKKTAFLTIHNTGGFDSEIDQRNYVASILGKDFLQSEIGKRLCPRMWHWLQGRYRFTAEFLASLIEDGLRRPHALLNAYIYSFGQFYPTDSKIAVEKDTEFNDGSPFLFSFRAFNFDRLKDTEEAISKINTIAKVAYSYFMRSMSGGNVNLLGNSSLFTECGIARWQYSRRKGKYDFKIQEPLVLLAATFRISLGDGLSIYQHLVDNIDQNASHRNKNGFEAYLVYFFARTFGQGARLGAVFNLQYSAKDNLSDYNATLVSLYQGEDDLSPEEETLILFPDQEGECRHHPAAFVRDTGPVHIPGSLAEHANDSESMEQWLRHRSHTAFCYPPTNMGPDLIFALKLTNPSESENTRYIWVSVQAKWYRAERSPNLKKDDLRNAIKSVTPNRYFLDDGDTDDVDQLGTRNSLSKQKGNRERLKYRDTALKAMDDLVNREPLAGSHSVLRVVATFPQDSNFQVIPEVQHLDTHPLASLNRQFLMARLAHVAPTHFLAVVDDKDRRARLDNPDGMVPGITSQQIERLADIIPWEKNKPKLDVYAAAKKTDLQDQIDRIRAFKSWRWIPCKSWRIDSKEKKSILSEFVIDLLQDRYTFTDDDEANEEVVNRRTEVIRKLVKQDMKYEDNVYALITLATEESERDDITTQGEEASQGVTSDLDSSDGEVNDNQDMVSAESGTENTDAAASNLKKRKRRQRVDIST